MTLATARDVTIMVGIMGAAVAVAVHLRDRRREQHRTQLWRMAFFGVGVITAIGAVFNFNI